MDSDNALVFETPRLRIRRSIVADADLLFRLWTTPAVMKMVGFPQGLRITREEVARQLERQADSDLDIRLVVEQKPSCAPLGECKLGTPDEDGISETDVKLLPEHWGQGYGTETKQGLVDYLFTRTACTAVKATPNQENVASQRMQEAVGGRRVGETVFRFPEAMRDFTCDVFAYVYLVERSTWEQSR